MQISTENHDLFPFKKVKEYTVHFFWNLDICLSAKFLFPVYGIKGHGEVTAIRNPYLFNKQEWIERDIGIVIR